MKCSQPIKPVLQVEHRTCCLVVVGDLTDERPSSPFPLLNFAAHPYFTVREPTEIRTVDTNRTFH